MNECSYREILPRIALIFTNFIGGRFFNFTNYFNKNLRFSLKLRISRIMRAKLKGNSVYFYNFRMKIIKIISANRRLDEVN